MSSRNDSRISAEAWDDLRDEYVEAGGEDASDRQLAQMLRQKMVEVEG